MQTSRRSFLTAAFGTLATVPLLARDFGKNAEPIRYPEPDVIALTDAFKKIKIGNAAIERLHTGMRWAEGPAWSGQGQYLMWSDIPNNAEMRYLPEDNHVSVLRKPSNYGNGNTFDPQGRQVTCEHETRRVVRYEPNGTVTVLAETYGGKPFNAPNDIVVHPDGGVWFSDPGYGALVEYEGKKGPLELKEAVYRIDPATAKVEMVTDVLYKPNGLCFSPDYKKLYICDTGATHYPKAPKNIVMFDVIDGRKLGKGQQYCSMKMAMTTVMSHGDPAWKYDQDKDNNVAGLADGIRCDTEGNIWVGSGWVGPGYDGVQIFSPEGERIGQILLPEICANICFGGRHRNRLFMAASQSLYAVYVEATGAHFC
ncbi:MAG TPA: SMP-30/gluconolactonase/LRE family protein [Chthoniobacter sp.]|jgi:gluconolactonase